MNLTDEEKTADMIIEILKGLPIQKHVSALNIVYEHVITQDRFEDDWEG